MSNNLGHPLDGQTSECTQVTVEIARPGRSPVIRSITIVELGYGSASMDKIMEAVEDTAREAVKGAYTHARSAQL